MPSAKIPSRIPREGLARRVEDTVEVLYPGDYDDLASMSHEQLVAMDGFDCLKEHKDREKRVYRKTFRNKGARHVFLHDEFEQFLSLVRPENTVVLGATGYSKLGPKRQAAWQITEQDYLSGVEDTFLSVAGAIRGEYPESTVHAVHGASYMGVDRAIIDACSKSGINHFGTNCIRWALWVKDDGTPLWIAKDKNEYSNGFVKALHVLLSVGGAEQALFNDLVAATRYKRCLILCPMLEAIAPNGTAPNFDEDDPDVMDATAVFSDSVNMIKVTGAAPAIDQYASMVDRACEIAVSNVRRKRIIKPEFAFRRARHYNASS